MAQYKEETPISITGKVVSATLDYDCINDRDVVVVSLNDNAMSNKLRFAVPTTQEIRDRFFYKKAKTQPNKPARPPNKFFIFRTTLQTSIDNYKWQVPRISGLASEIWRCCTPEVIEVFTKLSQTAKVEHSQINPGYVYKPNRLNKTRVAKSRTNSHIQQDLTSSPSSLLSDLPSPYSPTAPVWTNNFDTNYHQDSIYGIPTSQTNSHSDKINDSITTKTATHQTISSQFAYLTTIDSSSIHDINDISRTTPPLETIQNNPYIQQHHHQQSQQQQFYQCPLSYYSNTITTNTTELSMDQHVSNSSYDQDVNVMVQPIQPPLTPYQLIHHVDDGYNANIFNFPFGDNDDVIPFYVEQIQESGCVDYPDYNDYNDYSHDHYPIFSQNLTSADGF